VKSTVDAGYEPGECSRESDIVGTPATGTSPPCGRPPLSQRRLVIDAILEDGSRMILENNLYATMVWDTARGSWYLDLDDTGAVKKFYFKSAMCVLPPVAALTPNCECPPLLPEPAISGNYNPKPAQVDVDPCCTQDYVQMNCIRAYDSATTYSSGERLISCTMGVWMMIRTGSSHYNAYALKAATCVD
ncbi:hypothetical protein PENTCL1PPCAC_10507, partial [Pristionchus entomophagus]